MSINPFKAMSRSRSRSGDRERETVPVSPPTQDTVPPGLPPAAPPPAPPRPPPRPDHTLQPTDGAQSLLLQPVVPSVKQTSAAEDSDLDLVTSEEVMEIYNDQPLKTPANVLIKNMASGGLYAVQKGERLDQRSLGARPKIPSSHRTHR